MSMFVVYILLFTALLASGIDDTRYQSEKGYGTCGKAWQKGRRLSSAEKFDSKGLREAFGREREKGSDLCSACESAISTWRRTGKRSKVNSFTKLTFVSSVCRRVSPFWNTLLNEVAFRKQFETDTGL